MQKRMQEKTIIKLSSTDEKRCSVMVSERGKDRLKRLKGGLSEWQFFNRLLEVYERYGHLLERSEDVA